MAINASDITDRFPEFAGVGTSLINLMIEDATLSIERNVWGDKADLATIYLVAHLLAVAGQGTGVGSAGGAVTKKKVGDLEKTFATPSSKVAVVDGDLGSTVYGRLFLRLRREIVKSPLVINFNQDYDT